MISIRRLQLGEGELFKQIRLTALRDSPEAFGSTYEGALQRSPESWREQADSTAAGSDRATFLAFADDTPIGITALYRIEDGSDIGELLQVWVAPEYRGQEVAFTIMEAVFHWAGKNGYQTVIARVAKGNARALRFYRKYGFSIEKRVSFIESGDSIVLVKEIKP